MKLPAPEAARLAVLLVSALLVSALLVACGAEHTQAPAPFDPSAPAASTAAPSSGTSSAPPTPTSTSTAAASSGDGPHALTPSQKRPLEITSECATPANYYVGDDPKAGGTGKRSVDPLAVLPVERRPDGSQTVWLLDEHFEPLIKVSITRGMKKIEIGRSCRTLDAR
jgi:hypothetical protein